MIQIKFLGAPDMGLRRAAGMVGLAAVAMSPSTTFAQSTVQLPLDAENCAIHNALSPETAGPCATWTSGTPRGIVLRIDDAIKHTPTPSTPSQPASSAAQTLQTNATKPIAPTVQVAASSTTGTLTDATAPTGTPTKPTSNPNHAAAAPASEGYFVQFAFDSTTIEPQFKTHLDRLSEVLKVQAMEQTCLKVIGHTDTVGSADYNKKLSEKRALVVAQYLRDERGIPAVRLSLEAAGEDHPLPGIDGDDALNRRVEFATKPSDEGC